jgi:hypothetical protein
LPNYLYRCINNHEWDIDKTFAEFAENKGSVCPACSDRVESPCIVPFNHHVVNINCLGIHAEKNSKALGANFVAENEAKRKQANEAARELGRQALEEKLGVEAIRPSIERPWYRQERDTADLSLTKMNKSETERYVIEGVKPFGLEKRAEAPKD